MNTLKEGIELFYSKLISSHAAERWQMARKVANNNYTVQNIAIYKQLSVSTLLYLPHYYLMIAWRLYRN